VIFYEARRKRGDDVQKQFGNRSNAFLTAIAMGLGVTLVAACAGTAGKTDWQAKIGHDSLEDATRVLGVPESCAGLDDGGTACSWTRARGTNWIDKLVLTFDPQGRLATANEVRF
jgi:hypothetical protein